MHSRRVAPFNNDGDEVHLRSTLECSSKKCRTDLGLSPPFNWDYAVMIYDGDSKQWTEVKDTFTDFEDADNLFLELSEQKFSDLNVSRLEAGSAQHEPSSATPR